MAGVVEAQPSAFANAAFKPHYRPRRRHYKRGLSTLTLSGKFAIFDFLPVLHKVDRPVHSLQQAGPWGT